MEYKEPTAIPRALLRIHEAATALGIGRSTLYKLISDGEIQTIRVGKTVRIPVESLKAWIKKKEAEESKGD